MELPPSEKKILGDSAKQMIKTRRVARIHVGRLCRTNRIRRRAFRAEFTNRACFLEWVFYSEFLPCVVRGEGNSMRFMTEICRYFEENREMYCNIFMKSGINDRRKPRPSAERNVLIRSFAVVAPLMLEHLIDIRYTDEAARASLRESQDALLGEFREALVDWLQTDAPEPAADFAAGCLKQLDEYADVACDLV